MTRFTAAARRRRWPLAMTLISLVTGLAYSFFWAPLVRHQSAWLPPGDIWGTMRAAHWVAWGAFGDVYGSQAGLVSFPGITLVLAPVSMLTSALGLTEGFPVTIAHPTAWLVVGPAILLLGAVPLYGFDALAEARGVLVGRRRLLTAVEAAALWAMVAYWGHPEDAIALGLVAYGLTAGYRGNWRQAGWLLGVGVAMQPLTLLVFPAVFAWAPAQKRLGLLVRAALPAGVLVAILLSADFSDTWRTLTKQPNYPTLDHATPWVWLSPSLGHGAVAAGPGRMVALGCAAAIGIWVWHRTARGRPVDIVWAASLAFTARCLFEPVMVPYYVTPVVAMAVLVAAERSISRLGLCGAIGLAMTVVAHTRAGPVRWWIVITMFQVALLSTAGWRRRQAYLKADESTAANRSRRAGVRMLLPRAEQTTPALAPGYGAPQK